MDSPKAKNPIKATETTFRILNALKEMEGAGVTELSKELDIPKSSVHNYLSTLRQEEYVVKEGQKYRVGLRLLELGSYARHQKPIYDVARPELDKLAEQTGELVNLMVEEHGRGIYIYRSKGGDAVSVNAYTGHRVYLHNTALGKAILSEMPEGRVEEIIDRHGLPASTEHTINGREELFDALEAIRERGVAFDREEHLHGLKCAAMPVTRNSGAVQGAISIAGPTSRMKGERFEEELPELLGNAVNIVELNITYG